MSSGKTVVMSPAVCDAAIASGSAAVGGAGPSNLLIQRTSLVYQPTSLTPYVVLSFEEYALATGLVPVINALFFGYFNSQRDDTFRVRSASAEAGLTAGPTYDSGSVLMRPGGGNELANYRRPHRFWQLPYDRTDNWWRIDFDWTNNYEALLRGSRLVLGNAVRPSNTADADWAASHSESVVELEDMNGGQSTRPRGARRKLSLGWGSGSLDRAEAAAVQQTLMQRGSARDLVVCVDTDEAQALGAATTDPMSVLYLGRVKQEVVVKNVPVAYKSINFEVEELGVTEMRY